MRRVVIRYVPLAGITFAFPAAIQASERHFTYAYESSVLAPSERELELWSTYRRGRVDYYSELDNRVELEIGVTDTWMTAFYLNTKSVTTEDPATGATTTQATIDGVSWEWKAKLLDPVADPVGFAVLGEVSLASDEAELELRAIVDKKVGASLIAFNIVVEPALEMQAHQNHVTTAVGFDLGATRFITSNVALGIELRDDNTVTREGDWQDSALFAGPVAFYRGEAFWAALTIMPQIVAFKGATPGYHLVLDEHERFDVRLLFSTHF